MTNYMWREKCFKPFYTIVKYNKNTKIEFTLTMVFYLITGRLI